MEMLGFSLEAMQVDQSRNESIREAAVWTRAEEGQKMAAKTGAADRRPTEGPKWRFMGVMIQGHRSNCCRSRGWA